MIMGSGLNSDANSAPSSDGKNCIYRVKGAISLFAHDTNKLLYFGKDKKCLTVMPHNLAASCKIKTLV